MGREVLAAKVLAAVALVSLVGGSLEPAFASGAPGFGDDAPRAGLDPAAMPAGMADEPPGAEAVAAYIADVLTPEGHARRTPTGYAMLDAGSRVLHTVDVALTSHQCWKIKDGYQCRSTVRTTMTPASGRPHITRVEISNDYQWRGGRLFSARLEAMRQQALAPQAPEDGDQAQAPQGRAPGNMPGNAAGVAAAGRSDHP